MQEEQQRSTDTLLSCLLSHGITRAVLCPGSRNAPLVYHLMRTMTCTPVTDERSAAFCALGIAQATGQPTVVCVTSGSALLNVAPAVAEARYQHVPLIVVSADRPQRWIDRHDGQTLPQPTALTPFVRQAVNLPEHTDDEQRDYCRLLVSQALHAATWPVAGPVHINVPLNVPFFDFDPRKLASERAIELVTPALYDSRAFDFVLKRLTCAKRPMIVVGQTDFARQQQEVELALQSLRTDMVVLTEKLSDSLAKPFDLIVPTDADAMPEMAPDFVLTMGGTLVSKRLRRYLRQVRPREVWEVDAEGRAHATFGQQTGVMAADPGLTLRMLAEMVEQQYETLADTEQPYATVDCMEQPFPAADPSYLHAWGSRMRTVAKAVATTPLPFSQALVVREFEQLFPYDNLVSNRHVHYANSSAVRLGCLFSHSRIWCNRGVNGIEGSLSTAAGFSLDTARPVYCVTGDLSFFYDQNAFWNDQLRGNLRVLLLNNGGGGIFHQLPGMERAGKALHVIAGDHSRTAEGTCRQHGLTYLTATDEASLADALPTLLGHQGDRPVVLEVFTRADDDARAMQLLQKAAAQ